MKKSLKITYNTIIIILLNIVYYICNYYPKHIIEFSSWKSLLGILLNFIFYILFFSIIIIVFKKDKTVFSSNLFNPFLSFKERFEIKLLFRLLSIQIVIDLVYSISSLYLTKYSGFIATVLTLIGWSAFYFVTTHKKHNLTDSKKHFVLTLAICSIFFVISIYFDYKILNSFNTDTARYQINSLVLQNTLTNLDYFLNLKNFIFDTIIGVALVILHFLSVNTESVNEDNGTSGRKFVVFSIRVAVLIVLALILTCVRYLIFPYSALNTTEKLASTSKHYITDDSFYASSDCIKISRINEYNNEKAAFQKTTIKIYCNRTELCTISVDGFYKLYDSSISGNQMTMNDKFTEYEITGQQVFVLEDLAICYHENSIPKVVLFKEIVNQKESVILTATIKKLVSEGNVLLFVNSYEYLKKYDSEFAKSIAERYKNAEFTDNENIYINKIGYRTEFLQTFFKK